MRHFVCHLPINDLLGKPGYSLLIFQIGDLFELQYDPYGSYSIKKWFHFPHFIQKMKNKICVHISDYSFKGLVIVLFQILSCFSEIYFHLTFTCSHSQHRYNNWPLLFVSLIMTLFLFYDYGFGQFATLSIIRV